ncbi:hypothetical protein PBI_ISCA_79 [Mycobacterium phage Isca]|uniref:Uncharacterized protein n=1 Tax=Mycobacterium phage Isca TaxID=2656583 RepID=A0A649VZV0_9CAUD|nr:hypothetical protein PBI_ISCA_79 [Mycobacterium phage Isca]
MTAIESKEYEQTRVRLQADPIVADLSVELFFAPDEIKASLVHEDGSPTFEFMQRANAEYARRGGTDGGHIGGIAEAILRNVAELNALLGL